MNKDIRFFHDLFYFFSRDAQLLEGGEGDATWGTAWSLSLAGDATAEMVLDESAGACDAGEGGFLHEPPAATSPADEGATPIEGAGIADAPAGSHLGLNSTAPPLSPEGLVGGVPLKAESGVEPEIGAPHAATG